MSQHERDAAGDGDFRRILREQKRRVLAALLAEEVIDATPIVHDDEPLGYEAHVTLIYELHHVQLPELAAAGFVAFDRRADTVTRGPRFDMVRPFLSREGEIDWERVGSRERGEIRERRGGDSRGRG